MVQSQGRRRTGVTRVLPLVLAVAVLASVAAAGPVLGEPARPNILLIMVDDLNHWVGHLRRNTQVKTPNIDRLAAQGVTFTHAYAPAPACNPSRASMLSGLRPSSTGVYDNETDWRPGLPAELMLPVYLRRHGYLALSAGKIYHETYSRPSDWDEAYSPPDRDPLPTDPDRSVGGIRFGPLDCRDDELRDYELASWTIDQLAKEQARPFFLACGFRRPHMPWNVPRKWYDMYPLESVRLPPTRRDDLDDVPRAGVRMANPGSDHARIVEANRWREAVRAYMAAISYADMNVGRVLDALARSEHRNNTIVVLCGDHGWSLGEKQHWRKFALWEEPTRTPYVWVAPGVTSPGGVCTRPVDLAGFSQSIAELCLLPPPAHAEAVSLVPLLRDPGREWREAAVMTHGFRNHAVRTEDWRYIQYRDGGEELYDEREDPLEWVNLAHDPETLATRSMLRGFLPQVNRPAAAGLLPVQ